MKKTTNAAPATIAFVLLFAGTARAQHVPGESPGGFANNQDAHLLQKEVPDDPGIAEDGSLFGASVGGGALLGAGGHRTTPQLTLGAQFGYAFSAYTAFLLNARTSIPSGDDATASGGGEVDVHPYGTASLSPWFGIGLGAISFHGLGGYVEVPLGIDFRAPGTRARWGFFLAPSLAAGENLRGVVTIGIHGAF